MVLSTYLKNNVIKDLDINSLSEIKGFVFNKNLTHVIGLVNKRGNFLKIEEIDLEKQKLKISKPRQKQKVSILPISPPEKVDNNFAKQQTNNCLKEDYFNNRFVTKNLFNKKLKLIIKKQTNITPEIVALAKRHNLLLDLVTFSTKKTSN